MIDARPKLLVLASTFPRWGNDTEPRFVESLCYELANEFDVTVLAPHCRGAARNEIFGSGDRQLEVCRFKYAPEILENLAYDGGMLSRLRANPFRVLLLPLFLLVQLLAVVQACRRRPIDAVHAHWIIPQGLTVAIFRLISRRIPPILVTSHGGDLYALNSRPMEFLKRWITNSADKVTVVSSAMRDYCDARQIAPGKIVVQSMGVDLGNKFTPGSKNASRSGLVFVGRLVDKKGVEHLVEAMTLLADSYNDTRLTIVGDGPLRERLKQLARDLRVDERVGFVGSVPNREVPAYLRAASVAVMPSVIASSGDQEGLGLVAVEAMGCGCAVVASDLPAIRDTVIDGETGLTARPADAEDLAAKIGILLGDSALRQKLADAGRSYAMAKFAWPIVGSKYREILSELLSGSS